MSDEPRLISARVRLIVLAALVIGAAIYFAVYGVPSAQAFEDTVRRAGPLAPLAFVLAYAVLTMLVFPGAVLTIAGGVVFGTVWGTVLAVIGASLGSAGAYLIGRRLGREKVAELAKGKFAAIDSWLERRGFVALLYARLIPIVPFNVLNYAAAVTGIRFREYMLATVIGIIPGTFAFTALGGSFQDPTSPTFLTAVGLVVVLAVGGPLFQRWRDRRGTGDDDTASSKGVAPTGDSR